MSTQPGDKGASEIAYSSPPDRITVALIPKVADELLRLHERTNLSKTDITNRAITLYEFIDAQVRAGSQLLIRNERTGEVQTLIIM